MASHGYKSTKMLFVHLGNYIRRNSGVWPEPVPKENIGATSIFSISHRILTYQESLVRWIWVHNSIYNDWRVSVKTASWDWNARMDSLVKPLYLTAELPLTISSWKYAIFCCLCDSISSFPCFWDCRRSFAEKTRFLWRSKFCSTRKSYLSRLGRVSNMSRDS